MTKMFAVAAAVAALWAYGPAQAAGNPAAGKDKSATCAGCHAADGNSTVAQYPKLAGQHAGYLLKQLKDFKAGRRHNQTMAPMVASLSEQDMADLAAYYADQSMSGGKADAQLADLGEKIYRGGNPKTGVAACASCHGPKGAGNPPAGFPKLSGQHSQYTVAQLQAFRRAGLTNIEGMKAEEIPGRANDPGRMMQNIAAKMSDEEIEAVASYIEGLR